MRQLSKLQLLIYNIGGLLIVVGAALPIFLPATSLPPYVFTLGALLFAAMQAQQRYEGNSITLRRLRRQQLLGALALIVAGALMFCSRYHFGPFVGAEWQMVLAIGAVLEVYTAFRIPAELKKSER